MGFAELFPACSPWIYMLFHRQLWKRILPCCFSKKLPNSNGIHAVNYYHRPISRGINNSIAEDHEDGNANNIQSNTNCDSINTLGIMTEDGSTADILTIRNVARKKQYPAKRRPEKAQQCCKTSIEALNSNKRYVLSTLRAAVLVQSLKPMGDFCDTMAGDVTL